MNKLLRLSTLLSVSCLGLLAGCAGTTVTQSEAALVGCSGEAACTTGEVCSKGDACHNAESAEKSHGSCHTEGASDGGCSSEAGSCDTKAAPGAITIEASVAPAAGCSAAGHCSKGE